MQRDENKLPAFREAKRCNRLALQWFAGDGGGAADAGEGTNGQDAAAPGQKPAVPGRQDKGDKNAAFEKLIRGEYKDQFAARTQRIIDQRFKESRSAQELTRALAQHYGLAEDDYTGITQAAMEGRSEAQRRETAQTLLDRHRQQSADAIYTHWQEESRDLQQMYPDFVMEQELADPAFAGMLLAGVPLRTAYEAAHLDAILGGAMQYAADKAAQAARSRGAALAARPAENGVIPSAGSVMQPNVHALTLAQREQIERRVARGETIRF